MRRAIRVRLAKLARLRFESLGTRLTVLYATMFAATTIAVAVLAQIVIVSHAQSSVRSELVTSGSVFERLWTLRDQSLADSADVLARDFGFRAAVASGDKPTIDSALVNLRRRAGVSDAFVVTQDGQVIGDSRPELSATIATVPFKLADGQHDAVVTSGADVYRVVVSPVLAPTEIGWVVFAVRLDGAEMSALQRLSAIPLTATILRRDPGGHWLPATGGGGYRAGALDRFMKGDAGHADTPATIALMRGDAIALTRPLAAASGPPQAVLLMSYPLSLAMAPYRPLQAGIIAVGLLGLALVLWGSRTLAGAIARPIVALDAAARKLEDGERTEVAIVGRDEIGRLARSFNAMSAGIVERENRIAHLAFHDTLTGLPNRAYFRQQLETMLAQAARRGEALAVLCLDIDNFKTVNDTLGHPVGDVMLHSVGAIVGELAGDGIVSRLGGDEFAIILTLGDADRPRALSQAIVDRMREPVHAAGHAIPTGTSIGIAVAPGDGDDAATLLKNADLALYRAKQDGRGVFRFFEPSLDAAARRRRQIELDLREALQQGQFRLDYQPIVDLKTNGICGFEALMRWDHPTRGVVQPIEFIPVAEETGLIVQMGEWVLHEACREAINWPGKLRVAVNVSPLQFRNSGLSNIVFQALTRSGLPPSRLEIEITESVFMEGTTSTLELLHRLRALGVRIALDDFGTGYSSLSYLRSFPFDKIKIDRSFVTSVAQDEGAAAIVRAIVDLATAFHMETTAEGVEDLGQLEKLRNQGCSSIQGFLFSRPVRASDVMQMLDAAVYAHAAGNKARDAMLLDIEGVVPMLADMRRRA
jgi:diguanylate cyclase (GGDEF)-like protein